MPAYVVVEIKVIDPVTYEEYKKLAPSHVKAFGGKYLARGGRMLSMEGGWNPERLVILEFESIEAAEKWANSPEYAPVRALRLAATESRMVILEGISDPPIL